jgi:PAS domain S-box-containing protein
MINTMAIKNKFMGANKKSYGVMDSMILAGIPIAICYWFLESILQIFFSGKYNFIAVFFGPDLYQIYTRVTVLCLFFIFGSHAQNIINKIRDTREELHESEEKYRTVADFTYDWEYWIGEKGNFEYVSPSCERISGYRADAFLKNPGLLNQIIHPVDRDEVSDHFRTELVRREVQSSEFRIITRNNRERWIGHVCQPVYGTDGQYRGKRASFKIECRISGTGFCFLNLKSIRLASIFERSRMRLTELINRSHSVFVMLKSSRCFSGASA